MDKRFEEIYASLPNDKKVWFNSLFAKNLASPKFISASNEQQAQMMGTLRNFVVTELTKMGIPESDISGQDFSTSLIEYATDIAGKIPAERVMASSAVGAITEKKKEVPQQPTSTGLPTSQSGGLPQELSQGLPVQPPVPSQTGGEAAPPSGLGAVVQQVEQQIFPQKDTAGADALLQRAALSNQLTQTPAVPQEALKVEELRNAKFVQTDMSETEKAIRAAQSPAGKMLEQAKIQAQVSEGIVNPTEGKRMTWNEMGSSIDGKPIVPVDPRTIDPQITKRALDAKKQYEALNEQLDVLKKMRPDSEQIPAIQDQIKQYRDIMTEGGVGIYVPDSSVKGGFREVPDPVLVTAPDGSLVNAALDIDQRAKMYSNRQQGYALEIMRLNTLKDMERQRESMAGVMADEQRKRLEQLGPDAVGVVGTGGVQAAVEDDKEWQDKYNRLYSATPAELPAIIAEKNKSLVEEIRRGEQKFNQEQAKEIEAAQIEARMSGIPDWMRPVTDTVYTGARSLAQAGFETIAGGLSAGGLLYDFIADNEDNTVDNMLYKAGEDIYNYSRSIPGVQYDGEVSSFVFNDLVPAMSSMAVAYIPTLAASKAISAVPALARALPATGSRSRAVLSLIGGVTGAVQELTPELQQMLRAVENGEINPDTGNPVTMGDVYLASGVLMAGNTALEAIGFDKVFGLGKKALAKDQIEKLATNVFAPYVMLGKQMTTAGAAEALTETAQAVLSTVTAKQLYDFSRELTQEELARTALASFIAGSMMRGTMPAINNERDAQQVMDFMEDLLSKSKDSITPLEEKIIREKVAEQIEIAKLPAEERLAVTKSIPQAEAAIDLDDIQKKQFNEVAQILNAKDTADVTRALYLDEDQQAELMQMRRRMLSAPDSENKNIRLVEMLANPRVQDILGLDEVQRRIIIDAMFVSEEQVAINVQDSPLVRNGFTEQERIAFEQREQERKAQEAQAQIEKEQYLGKTTDNTGTVPTQPITEEAADAPQMQTKQERIEQAEMQAIEQQTKAEGPSAVAKNVANVMKRLQKPPGSMINTMTEAQKKSVEDVETQIQNLGYSLKNPLWTAERRILDAIYAKARANGADPTKFWRKLSTTRVENWGKVGKNLSKALGPDLTDVASFTARVPAKLAIAFSKTLPRTQAQIRAYEKMRGKAGQSARLAYMAARDMHEAIGRDPKVMADVFAALDHNIAAALAADAYSDTYNNLTEEERPAVDAGLRSYGSYHELPSETRLAMQNANLVKESTLTMTPEQLLDLGVKEGLRITPDYDATGNLVDVKVNNQTYNNPEQRANAIADAYLKQNEVPNGIKDYNKYAKGWLEMPAETKAIVSTIVDEVPVATSLDDSNGAKTLYESLRAMLDHVHEMNYKMGFLDEETYQKFKGRYSPRMYMQYEMPELMDLGDVMGMSEQEAMIKYGVSTNQMARMLMGIDGFQMRQDISKISSSVLLDPIYAAMKRYADMQRNMAIYEYGQQLIDEGVAKSWEDIATEDDAVRYQNAEPPLTYKGYVKMTRKQRGRMSYNTHGPVTDMYVPADIAADFDASKFYIDIADNLLNSINAAVNSKTLKVNDKSYPNPIGLLNTTLKKYNTVWNPAMHFMNLTTNGAFMLGAGVNPMTATGWAPLATSMMRRSNPQKKLWQVFDALGTPTIPTASIGRDIFEVLGLEKPADAATRVEVEDSLIKELYSIAEAMGIVDTDVVSDALKEESASIQDTDKTAYHRKLTQTLKKEFEARKEYFSPLRESAEKVGGTLQTIDQVMMDAYMAADTMSKLSAWLTIVSDETSKAKKKGEITEEKREEIFERAATRVAEGFQNHYRVGKLWADSAKIPFIGNPYVKFKADLLRIMGNWVKRNPLSSIAMYQMWIAFRAYTYALAGFDEEEKELLDDNAFQKRFGPRLKMFGYDVLGEPLTFYMPSPSGGKALAVDVSRWISPLNFMDTGETGRTTLEQVFDFFSPWKIKQEVGFPLEGQDLLLSPLMQLSRDKDFRGRSIKDPDVKPWMRGTASIATEAQAFENQVNFLLRSYVPWYSTVNDWSRVIETGTDYYGRPSSMLQLLMNKTGIKIRPYNMTVEMADLIENKVKGWETEYKSTLGDQKKIPDLYEKDAQKIAANDNLTKDQRNKLLHEAYMNRAKQYWDKERKLQEIQYKAEKFITKYAGVVDIEEASAFRQKQAQEQEQKLNELGKYAEENNLDITNFDEGIYPEWILGPLDAANSTIEEGEGDE